MPLPYAINQLITFPITVLQGGTGATTAADARTNLGALATNGDGSGLTGVAKLASPNTFADTTQSTSTTTGAQIISGGVGIAKNIWVGGLAQVTDTTDSTSASTGALIVKGGISCWKKLRVGDTTASTSDSTGALVVLGGAGFSTDIFIGNLKVGNGPPGEAAVNICIGNGNTLSAGNSSTLSNVAIGGNALQYATGSSDHNVAIGELTGSTQGSISGSQVTTPTNCVWIGSHVYTGSTTPDYEIAIGAYSIGHGSGTTTIGTLGSTNAVHLYGTGINNGYLFGLTLSNNSSDATNDIDIATGEARDSTGKVTMTLGSSITKRLDASWSVGTGNGGLDTGSIANTTYHVFLIMRSDTGVVDALFSTSASSPTMPANYDYKRRIGSIVRAGAAILAFTQTGDNFSLTTPVLDVSVTNLGAARTTYTLASVPTGQRILAHMRIIISNAGATSIVACDLNETDAAPSTTVAPLFNCTISVASGYGSGDFRIWLNSSSQFGARSSAASTTFRVLTLGWTDRRGRDEA